MTFPVRLGALSISALLLSLCVALAPTVARAATEGEQTGPAKRWSIGLTAGAYSPDLRQLNAVLADPNTALLQDPNFLIPRNEALPASLRNVSTPELTSELSYGMEAQWYWRDRVSLVLMTQNWQGRSKKSDTVTMSLRSNLPPIDVPRTARYNMNLNHIWLGWRYALFDRPDHGSLFLNLGIAGLAVADFTMDTLLKVNQAGDGIDLNFASISSTEVHGTAYSSRYGLGGEFFVGKNMSIGFHANYIFAEMNEFRIARYFPSGFSELPPIPPQTTNSLPENILPSNHALPESGAPLLAAEITEPRENVEVVNNPRPVILDLDGWEFAFMARVYY